MTDPADAKTAADTTLVEETMLLFEKAARATQLYLANNPMYQQAIGRMQEGFRRLWQDENELNLTVTADCFQWEEQDILAGREKNDSLAWVLYGDGVRAITLLPGVEETELVQLLAVIKKARMLRMTSSGGAAVSAAGAPPAEEADVDDDLQTLLWTEDFEFIRYHVIEIGDEDFPTLEPSSNLGSFPAEISQDVRQDAEQPEEDPLDTGHQIASADDFNPTLYFLDPKEVAYLKSEIDREYELDLHGKVLRILFDLFEAGRVYGNPRPEVTGVLDTFMPFLLASGDFGAVAYIMREARGIAGSLDDLEPENRARLLDLPKTLSQPDVLDQLFQMLQEAHAPPTRDELGDLFSQLHPAATTTVLTWIPRFPAGEVRQALEEAVEPMARANPEELRGALASDSTETVMGALQLAIRIKAEALASELRPLSTHPDDGVRALLVEVLSTVGTPTMIKQLVELLDDEDREVRMSVATKLAERKYYLAADKLETIVTDRLRGADLKEKRVFFEVYGRLARDKSINVLSGILLGKGVFRRKDDAETRACAAMALGKVGEKARATLEQGRKEKDPVIRSAINAALREIGL